MAHAIIEARKSHDPLHGGWSPQEASRIFQSESRGLRTRWADGINHSSRTGKDWCPSWSREAGREKILPLPTFCSTQALRSLDDAHPHWRGQCPLLSLLIQILISSRHNHTDTPRNKVWPYIWASHGTVKLTHKMHHHRPKKISQGKCQKHTDLTEDEHVKICEMQPKQCSEEILWH